MIRIQNLRVITFFILVLSFNQFAQSQKVSVKADLDSTVLLIGQQSKMNLTISGPSELTYQLPQFPGDTLVNGVEVLYRGKTDTTFFKNGEIQLKTDYLITSFDSGLYYINPIRVIAGLDTFESNTLAIKILTYDVDTTNYQLYDIKGVFSPKFVISDYAFIILVIVLFYLVTLLAIWLYLRKKYKTNQQDEIKVEKYLPPHVRAIIDLDRLKSEKAWRKGQNKEFYTKLTDILRTYIENRFKISAMEMTTAEILPFFKKDKNTQSVYQNLRQILQTSDLVKFAKFIPEENENELSIMNAYLFVNQTKIEEIQSIEEQKEAILENVETVDKADVVEENDYLKKYQRK